MWPNFTSADPHFPYCRPGRILRKLRYKLYTTEGHANNIYQTISANYGSSLVKTDPILRFHYFFNMLNIWNNIFLCFIPATMREALYFRFSILVTGAISSIGTLVVFIFSRSVVTYLTANGNTSTRDT